MIRKMRRVRLILLLIALIASCTYKPPQDPNARPGKGMNLFPEWFDNMISEEYGDLYIQELPVLNNAPVQKSVEELGRRLVTAYYGDEPPPYHFQFHVVNLDIINAFALPGGHIFVFRGLLQDLDSEAELAGVLSHEMGHVVARHGTKNMSKDLLYSGILAGTVAALEAKDHEKLAVATYIIGNVGLSLGLLEYSRNYEREADWIAVHNCYRAGYNPEGMISLFDHFKNKEGKPDPRALMFFSTHPSPQERQANVLRELPKLQMAREWNQNQYGFSAMEAELKTMPPAPKDLDGKDVLALSSLNSMVSTIASSRTKKLNREYQETGTQTVKIYVPSNEEWTDTSISLRPGQRVEFHALGRNLSSGVGGVKGCIRKDETVLQNFSVGESATIEVDKAGRLFLGMEGDNLSSNEGWYAVTTRIH